MPAKMKEFKPMYPLIFLAAVGAYYFTKQSTYNPTPGAPTFPQDPPFGAPTNAVPSFDIPEITVTAYPYGVSQLAMTIWGEARGEGYTGMQAVANVVVNRVKLAQRGINKWWGSTIADVCLMYRGGAYQFSCWNPRDPNRAAMVAATPADPLFAAALEIAGRAYTGTLPDLTGGSTSYHTKAILPYWAKGQMARADIGSHLFYTV